MKYYLIVSVLAVLHVCSAIFWIRYLGPTLAKLSRMRNLCVNTVNSVIAVTVSSDYWDSRGKMGKMFRDTSRDKRLVKVNPTFIFCDPGTSAYEYRTGSKEDLQQLMIGCSDETELDLRVPFVDIATFATDMAGPRYNLADAYYYIHSLPEPSHRATMTQRLWARAVTIYRHREFNLAPEALWWIVTIVLFGCLLGPPVKSFFFADSPASHTTSTVVTSQGVELTDTPTYSSGCPDDCLLMLDDDFQNILQTGVIIKGPLPMGGELATLRIQFDDNGYGIGVGDARASSSLNLQKGDRVITRFGKVRLGSPGFEYERWVITPAEADKLAETGRFQYQRVKR